MSRTAAVITISDKGYSGERQDTSGPALCALLTESNYQIIYTNIIPDDRELIEAELKKCADELNAALILTTGGTGFSPRDVTPEATKAVIEKETPGIPEAMRSESLKITPKGCLSRSVAGIRRRSLIINLPGSKKAALENIQAVRGAIDHGLEMLNSQGSANCGERIALNESKVTKLGSYLQKNENPASHFGGSCQLSKAKLTDGGTKAIEVTLTGIPSLDQMLTEAKKSPNAHLCGMYLTHCGVVRKTARSNVREGDVNAEAVTAMDFAYDAALVDAAIKAACQLPGIYHIQVWVNEGRLQVGDDLMRIVIGGDIRTHVMDAMTFLLDEIKSKCVTEKEIF